MDHRDMTTCGNPSAGVRDKRRSGFLDAVQDGVLGGLDWSPIYVESGHIPSRQRVEVPEVRLVRAMLAAAMDDCRRLAAAPTLTERRSATLTRERAEDRLDLAYWITDESRELHSLGWLVDTLVSLSGQAIDEAGLRRQMLAMLEGTARGAHVSRAAESGNAGFPASPRRRARIVARAA